MREGSTWRKAKLDDVVDLRLSSVDKKSKPGEHGVRLCNYVDVYKNRFIRSDTDFMLATATDREIAKCTLLPGDVVITKDSEQYDDIGVPALIRENIPNLVCGYHLAILRPKLEFIDGTYLFYAVSSFAIAAQFHSLANGVTRFGLRKDDILRVQILLPPLSEQRAIAHILGTLDDKIESNRRMNETLEDMARALFKSWFVDFDPVRAKMEGRWLPGHSLPGLPAESYDLFPDRLVDSQLGPIPDGWQVKPLGTAIVKQLRNAEDPQTRRDTLFRHYSIPAFDQGKLPHEEYGSEIRSTKLRLLQDVVLVSKLNPQNERVWLVDVAKGEKAICSTEFLVFSPCPPLPNQLCLLPS